MWPVDTLVTARHVTPYTFLQIMNQTDLPSFNFGNGLVEFGALTTLIGSTIAELLVLGNKGPGGLVWAIISAFGISSVVKACASAASPGWLRQMFGLRTPVFDGVVGMDLPLSPNLKVAQIVRGSLESALGISCNSEDLDRALRTTPNIKKHHSCRDIYAFDFETRLMLDRLPPTPAGKPPTVYTFYSYPFFRSHNTASQIAVLGVSLIKYSEVYFLFTYATIGLGLLSAIPFTFFLLAAICIEIGEISACRRSMDTDGHVDIIAGILPTVNGIGGHRKVVLGTMKNPKTSWWWRSIWISGALLHTVSLAISYVLLRDQSTQVVLTWTAFQGTWLVLRTIMSLLTDTPEPMAGRPLDAHQLDALPSAMKLRVANLILAVANYQTHSHPRGLEAYSDDSFSTQQVSKILAAPNIRKDYILPQEDMQTIALNVFAVIGDTTLSSTAWMLGSTWTSMDVYDSCIIVLNSLSSEIQPHRLTAIPAVRVFSKTMFQAARRENSDSVARLFIPRGSAGGSEVVESLNQWLYWIPCGPTRWLQFKCKSSATLGKHMAEVVSDAQITDMLNIGNLHISLKGVEEVKAILKISREATNYLTSLLH